MELNKNQVVVFEDGHKEGYLEARWSERAKAFYSFNEDGEKIYSVDIREKATREKRAGQTSKSQMVEIYPVCETEKAYGLYDGTNGCITRGNIKVFYKWVAKSLCTVEDGKVLAPYWAV